VKILIGFTEKLNKYIYGILLFSIFNYNHLSVQCNVHRKLICNYVAGMHIIDIQVIEESDAYILNKRQHL